MNEKDLKEFSFVAVDTVEPTEEQRLHRALLVLANQSEKTNDEFYHNPNYSDADRESAERFIEGYWEKRGIRSDTGAYGLVRALHTDTKDDVAKTILDMQDFDVPSDLPNKMPPDVA